MSPNNFMPVGNGYGDGYGYGNGYGYGYGNGYGNGNGDGDGYGYGYGYGDGDGYGDGYGYGYGDGSILTAKACGYRLVVHSIDRIEVGCQVNSLPEWRVRFNAVASTHGVDQGEAREALDWIESLFAA